MKFSVLSWVLSALVTGIALGVPAWSAASDNALTVIKDCPDCPEMVKLPAMASHAGPVVMLYAARTELTWRAFLASVTDGSCNPPYKSYPTTFYDPATFPMTDDYPVTGVSLAGIDCYTAWLKRKTGKTYRLPTGEEWEYLARAGTTTRYPWGDEVGFNNAIVDKHFDAQRYRSSDRSIDDPRSDVRSGSVYVVGQMRPNPWGLYDVVGNASEATSERGLTPDGCAARAPKLGLSAEDCVTVVARGGNILLKNDVSPFEDRIRWLAASPSWGIRLVREEAITKYAAERPLSSRPVP